MCGRQSYISSRIRIASALNHFRVAFRLLRRLDCRAQFTELDRPQDAIYGSTEIGGFSVSLLPDERTKDHLIWEIETSLTTCMSHQLTWIDCQVQGHLLFCTSFLLLLHVRERQHWTLWLVSTIVPNYNWITYEARNENDCDDAGDDEEVRKFVSPADDVELSMRAPECVSKIRKFLFSFFLSRNSTEKGSQTSRWKRECKQRTLFPVWVVPCALAKHFECH